ncbi:MAG: hypothetical protein ACRD1Y_05925 [Terriglobales bacterium]
MRVALSNPRPNGHEPAVQVFAITGICQQPSFAQHPRADDGFRAYLGSAPLGGLGDDPYLLLRRREEDGAVALVLRVEWEGVFTLLANDDAAAEALFAEWLAPALPEEVQRQWTDDSATMELFRQWLQAT